MKRNESNGAVTAPTGGNPTPKRVAWLWGLAVAGILVAGLWFATGSGEPPQPPSQMQSAPSNVPSSQGMPSNATERTGSGAQPSASLPVTPAADAGKSLALPDEPLQRACRVRALIASAASAADLDASGLSDAILNYLEEGREQDAFDVLMEIGLTGKPWAMEYLTQMALRLRGMAEEARNKIAGKGGDAAEEAREKEWWRLARDARAPLAAMLASDTPAAREALKGLLEQAQSTGDLIKIAFLAEESGTEYGAELWREAFAKMTPEARADWVRGIAPTPPSLGGSGASDTVIRGALADANAEVRDACVDTLLAERMVQHPGASQWATELLTESFSAGEASEQSALDGVQRALSAGADSAGLEVGNIQAMEAVLELGRQSNHPEVQQRTAEIDAWIRQAADVEGIRARVQQDTLWIQQLCSTAP